MYFSEESVEQIRRLIAPVEIRSTGLHEPGKLQLDLLSVRDSGDDRLRVTAAKAARQVRQRRVEVLVLCRSNEGHKGKGDGDPAPEFHGVLLCIW